MAVVAVRRNGDAMALNFGIVCFEASMTKRVSFGRPAENMLQIANKGIE